jgi:hypothetical protein
VPSPWVLRASRHELPAKVFVGDAPAKLVDRRVNDVEAEGSAFICWQALLDGSCPFGHTWQSVSSADDTVELPIITYGEDRHYDISRQAREAFYDRQLIEDEATYPFQPFSDYVADHGTITGVCLRRPCPHHPA